MGRSWEYNALKQRFDGGSLDDYRAAKSAFIEETLSAAREQDAADPS
jgi:GrpB-like predicted nucleotidyltransferase (UPF0157 family)